MATNLLDISSLNHSNVEMMNALKLVEQQELQQIQAAEKEMERALAKYNAELERQRILLRENEEKEKSIVILRKLLLEKERENKELEELLEQELQELQAMETESELLFESIRQSEIGAQIGNRGGNIVATNPRDLQLLEDDLSEIESVATSTFNDDSDDLENSPPTTTIPNSSLSDIRGLGIRGLGRPVNPSVSDAAAIERSRAVNAEMRAIRAERREEEMKQELEQLRAALADRARQEASDRMQQEALQRRLQEEQGLRASLEAEKKKEQERRIAEANAEQKRKLEELDKLRRIEEARKQAEMQRLADERKKQAEIAEAARIAKIREPYITAKAKSIELMRKMNGCFFGLWSNEEDHERAWLLTDECQTLIKQLPANDPEHQKKKEAETARDRAIAAENAAVVAAAAARAARPRENGGGFSMGGGFSTGGGFK